MPQSSVVSIALTNLLLLCHQPELQMAAAASTVSLHFTACSNHGGFHYDIIDTATVPSLLSCANRCLLEDHCTSFNIWQVSQQEVSLGFECELVPHLMPCIDLSEDPIVTYYYIIEPGVDGGNQGGDGEGKTTKPAPTPEITWQLVLHTTPDGIQQGSVEDLLTEVEQGMEVRVLVVDTVNNSNAYLYTLDAVNCSTADGPFVVGTTYTYKYNLGSQTTTWVKIAITSGSDVTETEVDPHGFLSFTAPMRVIWYVRRATGLCENDSGDSRTTVGVQHVISSLENGEFHSYRLYSVQMTDQETGLVGYGIFIPAEGEGDLMFSLREVAIGVQPVTERVAVVDPIGGYSTSLETDESVTQSQLNADLCFYVAHDAIGNSGGPVNVGLLINKLNDGARILVTYACYDIERMEYVTHFKEAERVVISDALSGTVLVTAYVKGEATYTESSMSFLTWRVFTVNSRGMAEANGNNQSCLTMQFYAESRSHSYIFTVTRGGLVLEGAVEEVVNRLQDGHLPRLRIQSDASRFEFFAIESAEIQPSGVTLLRSYRYASTTSPSFNVFTFNVFHCTWTHEVSDLRSIVIVEVSENTQAESMSLFFI